MNLVCNKGAGWIFPAGWGSEGPMSKKKRRMDPWELGLPRTGVDSHAHLDLDRYEPGEIPELLDRAGRAGVARVGQVFLSVEAYEQGRGLFADSPEVFFLLAHHPNEAHEMADADMEAMDRAFGVDERLRAVGETGLDFYWDRAPKKRQEEVFHLHLDLALARDLPVVIHSREADEAVLAILDDRGFRDRPLLWHCFGGQAELAGEIVSRGWRVSVPGAATFSKNQALREAVASVPADRLLVETDCPFLAPEPWRGKRNEPAYAAFTAKVLAQARDEAPAELWTRCGKNAEAFFGL